MKRLILVTGEKGGVGKSLVSRVLYSTLKELNPETVKAFDSDSANATFFRFFKDDVKTLDITDFRELDSILEAFEEGKEKVIVDGAARSLDSLIEWMKEINLVELCEELDFKLSIVFVMGQDKDSVQILKDYTEEIGQFADWIIVKNEYLGKNFEVFDNSKIKNKIEKEEFVKILQIPELYQEPIRFMDKNNLNFEDAVLSKEMGVANRQRVKTWYRATSDSLLSSGVL